MLSISYQHIIIAAMAIIPLLFVIGYGIYRLIKYSVKRGIKESCEESPK
jgi:hypothetical protein